MKNTSAKWAKLIILATMLICCKSAYAIQKCGVRVGYTTFASASGLTGNQTYDINDIKFEGLANESFAIASGAIYGVPTNTLPLANGYYTIVQNLGWFNGNTRGIVTRNTDGTVVIEPNGSGSAVYKINGLTAGKTYHVRFIVSGVAVDNTSGWCNQHRMRPQFKITRANGVSTSGGGLANGTMRTITQPTGCTSDIPTTGTAGWDTNNGGNQTLNPNGHRLEMQCDVTVGGNGGTQWVNDNGFEIHFTFGDNNSDYILAIEEIEVTGCVEQDITSSQGLNPCLGTPVTLTATGWGLTTDIYEWRANGTVIAGATGYKYTVTPPQGTTTIYTVSNITNPTENPTTPISVSLTPENCCGAAATRFTVPKVCTPPNVTDNSPSDVAWNMAPWQNVNMSAGIGAGNQDCNQAGSSLAILQSPAGKWRCVYDNTNIYFLVEVNDANPTNSRPAGDAYWEDGVEIYLANANGGSQRQFGFGYSTANNKKYGTGGNQSTGNIYKVGNVWYLEIAIPLAANGYNTNSPYLLMELSINQSRPTETCRAAQIVTWNTSPNHYNSSANYTPAPLSDCASVVAYPDTICAGGTVNLSTQMSTTTGVLYTWEQSLTENGTYTPIQGASSTTTGTGVLNNVTPTNGTPMTSGVIWYRAQHGGTPTCPAKVVIKNGVAVTNPVGATICASGTAQIKADVSSGTVSWYSVPSGGTVIGTSASGALWTTPSVSTNTTFYAEATDNTCPGATRTAVTVTVSPENTITRTSAAATINQSICFGSSITEITYTTTGATSISISGLPSGITYQWSVGNGNNGTIKILGTPSQASGGTYNFTITLNGGCGNVTSTGTIIVHPIPVATISSNNGNVLNCAISTIQLTASGAGTGGTYRWSTNETTNAITVTTTGAYEVIVCNAGGCCDTIQRVITQDNNPPTVTVSGTTTICNGSSTTLTAAGASTYVWSPATGLSATTGTSVTANPTTSTTYTVTGTSGDGCTGTTTITIDVTPTNTITLTSAAATANQSVCPNNAITNITYATVGATSVSVTGLPSGVNYNWQSNILTISGTPTTSTGSPFNYTITLNGGCGNVTETGTITVIQKPTAVITSDDAVITCAVSSIQLNASGAGVGGTYQWSTGESTDAITVTAGGTYEVIVCNAGGCCDTTQKVITETPNLPIITVSGNTTICNGNSTTLTAAGAGTGSYNWSPITGLSGMTGTGASVTASPTVTTTYTVTGTRDDGCIGTTTVTIIVKDTYNTNDAVTICETELPYTYHNGQVFTTGGTKTVNFTSIEYCDSIVTLQINVTPITIEPDEKNICKADLPYRYQDAVFGIDTTFNVGTVSGNYNFYQYCKTKTLTLNILASVNSEEPQFPTICADDGYFYITIEPTGAAGDVVATQYEVIFPAGSAFTNQQGNVENGNKIRVDLPTDIYPNNYSCTIRLTNPASCAPKEFVNVDFDVYYPSSIMQQKWNDVVALLNNFYNGGYIFTEYQWFKNGQMLPNETHSYIYLTENEFNLSDSYYVQLTRADGTKMFSCPIELEYRTPISVFPTVISSGGNITVYNSPKKAVAHIYTVTGILVGSHNLQEDFVNTINAPTQQGTYLLEIRAHDNSERQVVPIVVNR